MNNWVEELKKQVGEGIIRENMPLKNLNTMKIGGAARVVVETAESEQIVAVVKFAQEKDTPLFILGGGSNVIFADTGFPGIILKPKLLPFKVEEQEERATVTFVAGYNVNLAASKLQELGWSGFEYMAGLPGTVGGAVYMNSKWPKAQYQTSDNLLSVKFVDEEGRIKTLKKEELEFSYGFSTFQTKPWIILGATFAFTKANPETILARMQAVQTYRKNSQPVGVLTAGCVFKNISEAEKSRLNLPATSAGYFIDQCGLKNRQIGGLKISSVHANFLVNNGSATSKDYIEMVDLVKRTVFAKFGVALREEVLMVK